MDLLEQISDPALQLEMRLQAELLVAQLDHTEYLDAIRGQLEVIAGHLGTPGPGAPLSLA